MGYNSQEEKKQAKSVAKKTQQAREFIENGMLQTLMDAVAKLAPEVDRLQEKAQHGPLSTEELELLNEVQPVLEKMMQEVSDAKLLLGNSVMVAATTQFFHLKKLAEEGNEEARQAYERLLPSYRRSMESVLNDPMTLN